MEYGEENKLSKIMNEMLGRIDELREENRQLKIKLAMQKPIYSRRKLEENFTESMAQLNKILNKYVELASCGDCGFWNPEEETDIRECRAFIKRVSEGK